MKRILSIALLIVFLFNVGGYYIVFLGLIKRADSELIKRLDANLYSQEETIELKIPLTLPYPIQEEDFKRVDGKFELNGEIYKLVKHKMEKDTVYIVCIKDQQSKKLTKAMAEYANTTSDLPSSSKKAIHFFGKLLKDFNCDSASDITRHNGWCREITAGEPTFLTLSPVIRISSPPPKV